MSAIQTGEKDLSYSDPMEGIDRQAHVVFTTPRASDVEMVLNADVDSDDGRSQWVLITFPNGDVFLATCPQGETYEAITNG